MSDRRAHFRLPGRLGAAGWAGAVLLAMLVVVAVAADWIAPFDATSRPGLPYERPNGTHLLGTDDIGRDIFSLLVLGARSSLTVAAGVALLSTVIGLVAGGVAGINRGWIDSTIMRVADVVLALPFLPLLIVAAAFLGRGILTQIVLISMLTWARPARIVRAAVLAALRRGHVESAVAMGARRGYLLARHASFTVAPLLVPLVVRAAMGAVLLEASLAFLGLGDPQRASWGTLLYWANVRSAVLTDAWLWWVVPPGMAIASMVVALGLVGIAWEERLNPSLAPATTKARTPRWPRDAARTRREVTSQPACVVEDDRRTAQATPVPHPAREPVLRVADLHVTYRTADGAVQAVRGMDLVVEPGARIGLVGESASGKTTVARTIAGLLPGNATARGRVLLDGRDLLDPRADWRGIRGRRVAYVPQGAMSSLNPVLTVGAQVAETLRAHRGLGGQAARQATTDWLERVGLETRHARCYPHELSGGMRQRAVLAAVLAAQPDVVVADEPTTGLDVLVGARVLDLLAELQAELSSALLLVSHDLRAVRRHCDRLVVCHAGRIVEEGTVAAVHDAPQHPYTARLLASVPRLDRPWFTVPQSSSAPPPPTPQPSSLGRPTDSLPTRVLELRGLAKTYRRTGRLRNRPTTNALQGVDLDVHRGEIVGLVGRSGSGKTTLLRCVLGLERPDAGHVIVAGRPAAGLSGAELRAMRGSIGYVAQDAYAALHPALTVAQLVAEPLRVAHDPSARDQHDVATMVAEALRRAGLEPTAQLLARTPAGLSGGQRQRVTLARGVVRAPALLLADEPTSMLDVSIRADIAATLRRLAHELGLAVLVVTHDIAEAAHLCDRIVVLDAGTVAEEGRSMDVALQPKAKATRALMQAVTDGQASTNTLVGG